MKKLNYYNNLGRKNKILFALKITSIMASIMLVIALSFVRLSSSASEFWTRSWTFRWVAFWGKIFGVVNFSVFELISVILVAFLLVWLIRLIIDIVQKNKVQAISKALSIICVGVVMWGCYYSVATVAYSREPLDINLAQSEQINQVSAQRIIDNYLLEFNQVMSTISIDDNGNSICPYTFEELGQKIAYEYERLSSSYYPSYIPKPKYITNSWLMSNFSIQGITFVPTAEGNINRRMPDTAKVFTMAHEMAHTMGIMRESEANIIASYVLINSNDSYLQYVGFFSLSGMDELAYFNDLQDYYKEQYKSIR